MSSSQVRDAYDEWAAQYDSDENATRDLNAEVLRTQVFVEDEDRVLEIGCGTGLNTQWLAAQVGHVVAVDFSEAMLEKARQRLVGEGVTLRKMDVTEPWPFDENSFDWVVSTLVLEHVEDLGPVFREARRVLRDGGTFYLAELHSYRQMEGTQANFERRNSGESVVVEAFSHSVSEFVNEGLQAGFAVRRMGEWRGEEDEHPRLLTVRFGAVPDAAGP